MHSGFLLKLLIYNETKYEALLAGLKIAKELGIKSLQSFMDSQLVAR